MTKIRDLTGQRFGRLTAIAKTGERNRAGYVLWNCKCDCGNETTVPSSELKRAKLKERGSKSCGCLRRETGERNLNLSRNLAKTNATKNSSDKAFVNNLSTGIKNISYKPNQGSACFVVNIARDKRKYSQCFSTLQKAINAKDYVLSRYKKGISNWNTKL
ncbi:hypothetical protein OGZ33_01800 [Lactococcus lactis]|uniref:hypothetical protein n=1 Tax=Lactococcus lactis TaxID=1358 RepID=UPI0024185100|nr:hypothetical protein [Lactococcus lactis]MDG4962973.1 hypothetical protein [Lactococcus lactis]